MRIYPDNTIVTAISSGKLSTKLISEALHLEKLYFIYSQAHLHDVELIQSSTEAFTREMLVNERLEFINQLTNGRFIFKFGEGEFIESNQNAFSVYKSIEKKGLLKKIPKINEQHLPSGRRELLRQMLFIDKRTLNRMAIDKVIDYLDECYEKAGCDLNFRETIRYLTMQSRETKKKDRISKIIAIYGLLEFLGFGKQYGDGKEEIGILLDSMHAEYGSRADFVLTTDESFFKKLQIVYHVLNIETVAGLIRMEKGLAIKCIF